MGSNMEKKAKGAQSANEILKAGGMSQAQIDAGRAAAWAKDRQLMIAQYQLLVGEIADVMVNEYGYDTQTVSDIMSKGAKKAIDKLKTMQSLDK